MLTTKLDEYPVLIADKPTFFGVLDEYYDYIFRRCNPKTRSSYNSEYNRHILPGLADRSIDEYELEDYEDVIQKVKEAGLKPSTVQHYRYLIRTVVKCAVKNNICQDVLFGSIYSISPDEKEDALNKNEHVRNRKSLKVSEEVQLFQKLMTNPKQDGPYMGLALMFALGLRNSEACGLKFSAIKEMLRYPGVYCAWVYETTKGETNQLKAGGKTRNAPRILPIPEKLLELLMRRKAFLQEEIDKGNICLSSAKGICSVEDLPIACQKSDYTAHCSSRHLTANGRLLLREIQVNEDEIAYIDRALQDPVNRIEMGVSEKDPTAYLLRRNLGTHLHILGLIEAQIQYFMGHDMEDLYADRNEFTNEERLYAIYQKLQNRPLFNEKYPHDQVLTLSDEILSGQCSAVHTANIHLKKMKNASIAHIQVTAAEPDDAIQIVVEGEHPAEAKISIFPAQPSEVSRTINVTDIYQRSYQKPPKREE